MILHGGSHGVHRCVGHRCDPDYRVRIADGYGAELDGSAREIDVIARRFGRGLERQGARVALSTP